MKKVPDQHHVTTAVQRRNDLSLLVTTNDSRIRLLSVADYFQLGKFKSSRYVNTHMQIKASFSEDNKYIIAGSQDGHVFIWNSILEDKITFKKMIQKENRNESCEYFDGTVEDGGATTCAIFLPLSSLRQIPSIQLQIEDKHLYGIVTSDTDGCIRFFLQNKSI